MKLDSKTQRDAVYPIEVTPNLPTVSTSDLEEQLSNTYKNALFLLYLAPIKEVSSPDSLDYISFLEEAMDVSASDCVNRTRNYYNWSLHQLTIKNYYGVFI